MFFSKNLTTYSPKNKASVEMIKFISSFDNILFTDEKSVKNFISAIRTEVDRINEKYSKSRPIKFEASLPRLEAYLPTLSGCPDQIFIIDICKVKDVYNPSHPTL